ncbi:hypothetical protein [Massilia sp. DWR3-1-1]|uniref:hypothetical protein n=1 Tax=Massilia sp. DWR3-1-1 TaxID=2804559 RepID=UPI003CF192F2
MSDFYKYFKENMNGLNLAAPEALFGTLQMALGTTASVLGLVEKLGTRVTVLDVIGAGTRMEALAVVGACSATYYVGAVIGSLAVATARSLAGGTSLADVMFVARLHKFNPPWLLGQLQRDPRLYKGSAAKTVALPVAR